MLNIGTHIHNQKLQPYESLIQKQTFTLKLIMSMIRKETSFPSHKMIKIKSYIHPNLSNQKTLQIIDFKGSGSQTSSKPQKAPR